MMLLSDIDEQPQAQQSRFALFDLGFRPFYLLASVFAALSIPLWSLQFSGMLGYSYLSGPLWHAHEMVFGFTLAVIVGFLFTAGRNWTNQPTPTGWKLAARADQVVQSQHFLPRLPRAAVPTPLRLIEQQHVRFGERHRRGIRQFAHVLPAWRSDWFCA